MMVNFLHDKQSIQTSQFVPRSTASNMMFMDEMEWEHKLEKILNKG